MKKVTDDFCVSGQIRPKNIAALKAQGFRGIINCRPDREGLFQPASDAVAGAASEHGLDYRHIPVRPGGITPDHVEAFGAAIDAMDGPVLAYCASGMRATTLWALSSTGKMSVDAILKAAGSAGYNLHGLKGTLEAHAQDASKKKR